MLFGLVRSPGPCPPAYAIPSSGNEIGDGPPGIPKSFPGKMPGCVYQDPGGGAVGPPGIGDGYPGGIPPGPPGVGVGYDDAGLPLGLRDADGYPPAAGFRAAPAGAPPNLELYVGN